jgi:FlaA1/EpsC-like NDP-sugar epimerase
MQQTHFSAVRYGNVIGSNGSVLRSWLQCKREGRPIQLVDGDMTRFFMTQEEAVSLVMRASMYPGAVLIPDMKSTEMSKLAKAFSEVHDVEIQVIPRRPGEKLHETLISRNEMEFVTKNDDTFYRWPGHDFFKFDKVGTEYVSKEEHTSKNAERFTEKELVEMCT